MPGLKKLIARAKAWLARLRERFGWLDHAIRAYQHFTTVKGNRLAAAVTYFGFLSLFPLLAIAVRGVRHRAREQPGCRATGLRCHWRSAAGFVGGEDAPINPETLKDAATAAGVIGAVLCCSPAPAWSMRFAKRCVVWSKGDVKVNFVLRKLADVLLLLVVGVIIIASVAVSSVTTSFANVVL